MLRSMQHCHSMSVETHVPELVCVLELALEVEADGP